VVVAVSVAVIVAGMNVRPVVGILEQQVLATCLVFVPCWRGVVEKGQN